MKGDPVHAPHDVQLWVHAERVADRGGEANVTLPGAGTRATLSESTGLLSSNVIIIIVTAALPDHCNATMTASYDWCMFRKQSQEHPCALCTTKVHVQSYWAPQRLKEYCEG